MPSRDGYFHFLSSQKLVLQGLLEIRLEMQNELICFK